MLFEAFHEGMLSLVLCIEVELEVHHCIREEFQLILVPLAQLDRALEVPKLSDPLDCLLVGLCVFEHVSIVGARVGQGNGYLPRANWVMSSWLPERGRYILVRGPSCEGTNASTSPSISPTTLISGYLMSRLWNWFLNLMSCFSMSVFLVLIMVL